MATKMTRMEQARSKMLIKHIFFASLILSTEMKPSKLNGTAWTDMVRIGYNEEFIESLDADTVMFVLAHEVFHIMLKHGLRRGHRKPQRWNIAADHAINLELKDAGFKLWDKCCADPRFKGMSAEEIYTILDDEAAERKKERDKKGKPKDKGKPQPGQGDPADQGEPTPGQSGGGGDEDPDDDEEAGGTGSDLVKPGQDGGEGQIDKATQAKIEQEINQKIAQAVTSARMMGQLPAGIARLVDGILNPPLPWQEILRDYMTRPVNEDESWSRRNRRYSRVVLPSRRSEAMGEIVVIGDTSGSMGDQFFAQVSAELTQIVEFVKPERVRIIWADACECAGEQIFEPGEEINMQALRPEGGGGTDMRLPLKFVEQFDPVVVLLLTDGYTPWPSDEPPFPLIVGMTTDVVSPVGETVRITVT